MRETSRATEDAGGEKEEEGCDREAGEVQGRDRKSTRLNSSHPSISYAGCCLKKKKQHAIGLPGCATERAKRLGFGRGRSAVRVRDLRRAGRRAGGDLGHRPRARLRLVSRASF